jgi:hypothetical protein
MRKCRTAILVVAVLALLVGAGVGLYWAFLPYPWALRQEARAATHYDPKWPVSKPEFEEAIRYVKSHLAFYEFISSIHVHSPVEMTITTTERWAGPLAASGRTFTFRKQSGKWIPPDLPWYWIS